ncbi:MAG: hypothetical protein ACYTGL_10865 [Planctomycetota bacterium]
MPLLSGRFREFLPGQPVRPIFGVAGSDRTERAIGSEVFDQVASSVAGIEVRGQEFPERLRLTFRNQFHGGQLVTQRAVNAESPAGRVGIYRMSGDRRVNQPLDVNFHGFGLPLAALAQTD